MDFTKQILMPWIKTNYIKRKIIIRNGLCISFKTSDFETHYPNIYLQCASSCYANHSLKDMTRAQNTVATPLVGQAYTLHKHIFNFIYPCPLEFIIHTGKIRLIPEKIFQLKYIPFITAVVIVTGLVNISSCVFMLTLQIFKPMETFSMVALILCLFYATCLLFECGVSVAFVLSREIVPALNQLFAIERTCKFFSITNLRNPENFMHNFFSNISDYKFETRKSIDWIGLSLIPFHFFIIVIVLISPII